MHIVVVGYGPVGARFVEDLLPSVREGVIGLTVVGAEATAPYNRVLVAEYAVGDVSQEDILVQDVDEVRNAGVRVLLGVRAIGIDRDDHCVRLDDGEIVSYDRLVLATGARANVPTLVGIERMIRDAQTLARHGDAAMGTDDVLPTGVTVLRDLADADRVSATLRSGGRIVVLGAGVLGLEFALLAARAGAEVCAVHHDGHPMARNLDRGAGATLAGAVRRAGVILLPHSRAEAVAYRTGDDGGPSFAALLLADGSHIPGDLLVLSCGVGARSELATRSGMRTAAGIVVTPQLESWSDADVYAIGDCAHVLERAPQDDGQRLPGLPSGLIGPGWRQAEWLAARLSAEASGAAFDTPPLVERAGVVMLKGEAVDTIAVGDVSPEPWDLDPASDDRPPRRVAQWSDPEHGRYVKMITRNGVLEAFASVGMPRTAAELTVLFERGTELPADRSLLLRFDGPDEVAAADSDAFAPAATVCWCNGVTVERIITAVEGGDRTVGCIGKATRAGTGCGGCKGRIAELIERTARDAAAVSERRR